MRRIMSDLINIIKEHTLAPRNDKMLHFSQHLNNNRHTVLYWWVVQDSNLRPTD